MQKLTWDADAGFSDIHDADADWDDVAGLRNAGVANAE